MFNLFKKLKNNQSGFGLAELMATISIIGVVSAVSAPKLNQTLAAARDAHRKMNIHQVETALSLYYDDNLSYPIFQANNEPTVEGWNLMKSTLENSKNSYIANLKNDPLNKEKYVYKYWSNGDNFKISYTLEDKNSGGTEIIMGL
ncbi:MAG: type II secretion system protein GspG [bacterium]